MLTEKERSLLESCIHFVARRNGEDNMFVMYEELSELLDAFTEEEPTGGKIQ